MKEIKYAKRLIETRIAQLGVEIRDLKTQQEIIETQHSSNRTLLEMKSEEMIQLSLDLEKLESESC